MQPNAKRIYLVGMPAAGKTTLAASLADLLHWQMLDLDLAIEQASKLSVAEIFSQKGEAQFRELERAALHANTPEHVVIATGGGAPCFFDNMAFMKANGLCIFLDVPVEELAKRAWKGRGKRPLLKSPTLEQMMADIEKKRKERLPFYKKAHISIEGKNIKAEYVLAQLSEK